MHVATTFLPDLEILLLEMAQNNCYVNFYHTSQTVLNKCKRSAALLILTTHSVGSAIKWALSVEMGRD